MSATYDLSTDIGKVRLTIGDKDITNVVFSDEELDVFLALNSDSIPLASADALEAWAASYGTNADSEKIGDYSYTQKIVDKLLALAERLRETVANIPALDWAEFNFTNIEEIA